MNWRGGLLAPGPKDSRTENPLKIPDVPCRLIAKTGVKETHAHTKTLLESSLFFCSLSRCVVDLLQDVHMMKYGDVDHTDRIRCQHCRLCAGHNYNCWVSKHMQPASSAASRHLPQLLHTGPTGAKEGKRSVLSRLLASVMAGTWNSRARKRSRPACQNLQAKLSKAQRPSCKRQDLTRPHTTPLSQSSLGRKLWVGKASLQHCEGSFCSLRQTWIHMA